MKVYFIGNEFTGLYNNRKELIERIIKNGDEVYFSVNPNGRNKELIDIGCEYLELQIGRRKNNFLKDMILTQKIMKHIKNIKPDIILAYNVKPVIYGSIGARLTNTPIISTITGLGQASEIKKNFLGKLKAKIILCMYKFAIKKNEFVFFQNEHDMNIFKKMKISELNRYHIVPGSGVDINHYSVDGEFKPNNKKTFLFIGRMTRAKGVEEFLNAAKQIKKNYNVKFQMLGKFEEQRFINTLVKQAEQEGIIEYLGFSNDVRNEIKEVDCLVLPSYAGEGMSNVLLQAASMKRVLLASNIPGCKEIIKNNKNGYLFEARSTEDLIIAIETLLKQIDEKWIDMGGCSRKMVEEHFDKEIVLEKYLKVIYY